MTTIEVNPATHMFYLSQAAHANTDIASKELVKHKRLMKNLQTGQDYHNAMDALRTASTAMTVAVGLFSDIQDILAENPELQA